MEGRCLNNNDKTAAAHWESLAIKEKMSLLQNR